MNHAYLHELISERLSHQTCLIYRDKQFTWQQITQRTRRLADVLRQFGLGKTTSATANKNWQLEQDTVGLYLYNCNEYLESMLAAYKARAVAFNVNYRYFDNELIYLFNNANAKAIIYHASFAPLIEKIKPQLGHVKLWIQVADESNHPLLDGSYDYEQLIAQGQPVPATELSPDDAYLVYTGGTTGLPKGVIWRQSDIFYAALHKKRYPNVDAYLTDIEQSPRTGTRGLPAPPFMHATAHWAAFGLWFIGGCVVIQSQTQQFDADDFWSTIEKHRVYSATIVGDAFAVPLLEQLRKKSYDLSHFKRLTSGGAVLSDANKSALVDKIPQLTLVDALGASEAGAQASRTYCKNTTQVEQFNPTDFAVVISQDKSKVLSPKDQSLGWLGRSGFVPLGYLGDEAKTKATFPVIDGTRYSIPGDRAQWQPDGSIKLLGRESSTINSGGEKIFAEEVECAIKNHPAVYDAIVIGMPHFKFGSQVTALIQLRRDYQASAEEITDSTRTFISGYKLPKQIFFVETLKRNPNGKPDFAWAKQHAKNLSRQSPS